MEDEKVVETSTEDYIEAINKLKSNTVDKAEYEKVREDNRKLLDSIVNGSSLEKEPEAPKLREPQEIRKELFSGDQSISNLDFAKKSLELREALIKRGEVDPFLPHGRQIIPTDEDVASAERVASVLAECVEYADGDNSIFTNELQRRTVDVRRR